MSVSLTGQDFVQIDDRILNDLADQDAVTMDPPNDLAAVKSGKNGNLIFALNETGRQMTATLRVLLGSADDKFLNSRLQEMKNNFSSFILLTGIFTKRSGDGLGNISTKVYQASGGVFQRQVPAKTSAEGDTEQSVAVYTIIFGNNDTSHQ